MNDLLFVMKLHLPVFATNKPEDKRDKDWAFEHEYVHGFIQQFVEDNYEAPEKVWSRKNVSYGHLWVFGFKAFVHVPKDERSKLDVKTRQCAFIGYGQDQFGNRFYDSIQKKLIRSCDAIFVENQFIKDIDKVQKAILEPNGDSTDVELIPPTVGSRQVRDDI
ncbi:hypothetical protein GH714_012366 [Hevea brasiliensis]|uniref:Retroviral polymerase SH3-like domain-containing protein n=1 Tax=Hevea brasiliensis TaxID=3981 RepID=A0A6A6L2R4_HEVBR|nr:hypothetical protein GH714_011971 [Hevea brasiliensis]KAF2294540.1 hypothetical protein GH714_012366 [Hevea brasiliensis]